MKAIFSYMLLLCYGVSMGSCHSRAIPQGATGNTAMDPKATATATASDLNATATPFNTEIKDTLGNINLIGRSTRQRLQQAPFDSWFVKNYDAYSVDSATADSLRGRLAGKQLLIFMGTWCGDSRREVPRIFKILDYCGIDPSGVRLIMVGEGDPLYKQSPGHEEKGLNIFRVPDLIVYDQGREMGRVIESPVRSLEKDLLAITSGEAYSPHYKGAVFLGNLFLQEGVRKIDRRLTQVAEQLRPLVSSSRELTGYAKVLRATGKKKEAETTLRLNTLIFPPGNDPGK